jgi:DNA repair protein RadA/Sms
MAKKKTAFMCQECGYDSPKWLGRCPACGKWNTFVEESVASPDKRGGLNLGLSQSARAERIGDVITEDLPRCASGSGELDRVLGGGIIQGSMVLVVGDPGVGKSSLMLAVCAFVARKSGKTLYVTGEESARQVKMRADRLGAVADDLYVLSETNLENIAREVQENKPRFLVIDSVQTIFKPDVQSAPGSVSQVRECAVELLRLSKLNNIALFVIGHVTKDGTLAGPRVLEHIVDTVLYFEGERNAQFRVLRAVKNRFGSTNEIGLFEMRGSGLADVPDASKLFLADCPSGVSGSVIVPTVEGTRPLLVEVQALVSQTPYVPPRRTADFVDIRRIQLLLAVLEKRAQMMLGSCDVYVKVAGSIKIDEPAVDLALLMALASSYRNALLLEKCVVFGEVGLAGEIRAVTQAEQRLREAKKLGFLRAIMPRKNLLSLDKIDGMEIYGVENIGEALKIGLRKN